MERTRSLIVTAFKAWYEALPDPKPFASVVYDNLKGEKKAKEPWARVSVQEGRPWLPFVGNRKRRRAVGFLHVQIFVPEDTGVTVATTFAQNMGDHFDDTDLSGVSAPYTTQILFRTTSLLLIAAKDGYQQHNASLEFQRDTIQA